MPTIAEKILGEKSGEKDAVAGDIVEAEVDYVMVNDVTGLPAFKSFDKIGAKAIAEKIVMIPDHYVPNKDVASAEQAKAMREFAKKHGITNYYEVGCGGVCHQIMIEKGFAAPGRLIVGADSHTCSYGAIGAFSTGIGSTEAASVMASGELWFKIPESQKYTVEGELGPHVMGKDVILHAIGDVGVDGALYKSMEWYGDTITNLSVPDRISISNMAIEAGGKAGIIPADEKADEYLKSMVKGEYKKITADEDAEYSGQFHYEASEIPCTVAEPFLPENARPAAELDVEVDQVYLGSCTNGRIEDMRVAAEIIKGKKVKEGVRMIVVPSTKKVMDQMVEEGIYRIFSDANAFISGPTCGACLGGYMGVLAQDEVCLSTTNRNFIGRMGHKSSKVYLASPAVAAATALTGKITDPNTI